MSWKALRLILILGLVLPSVLVPRPAYACSCAELLSPEAGFERSAAVFEGTVISVNRPSQWRSIINQLISYLPFSGRNNLYDWYNTAVTIDVHRSWKGVEVEEINVFTGRGGGDCGYGFRPGDDYLVYAYELYRSEGRLMTDICTNTKPITSAADDLTFLSGQPTLPLAPAPWDLRGLGCLGMMIIVAAVAGGGWFWGRRRREMAEVE